MKLRNITLSLITLISLSNTTIAQTHIAYNEEVLQHVEKQSEIISRYNILDLTEKEFLPLDVVENIMSEQSIASTPILTDKNYNHCIEHQENFWEIVKNGVKVAHKAQNNPKLTDYQKYEYMLTTAKMLSQITRYIGTESDVDISDYNNMKTFLFFERLIEHKDKYNLIFSNQRGLITERNEIFGRHYKDLKELQAKCDEFPTIRDFAEKLYYSKCRSIIEAKDSTEANKISMQILNDWLIDNYATSDLWRYAKYGTRKYVNMVTFYYWRQDDLLLFTTIDPDGNTGDNNYSPVGSTILHEMVHVMQKPPASKEQPNDNKKENVNAYGSRFTDYTTELGPTLVNLVIDDYIYKKIHNIPLDKAMNYGAVNYVHLGKLIVWFASKLKKYPNMSVERIILQEDVFNVLYQYSLDFKVRDYNIINNYTNGKGL